MIKLNNSKKFFIELVTIVAVMSFSVVAFAAPAEKIPNTASVKSPTPDTNQANNLAAVNDKLCYEVDIKTTLTDAPTTVVTPLSDNNYKATISNAGPSVAKDIDFEFKYSLADYDPLGPITVSTGSPVVVEKVIVDGILTSKIKIPDANLAPGGTINLVFPVKATANPGSNPNPINFAAPTTLGAKTDLVVATFTAKATATVSDDCPPIEPIAKLADNISADKTDITLKADLSIVKTSSGGSNSTVAGVDGTFISKTNQTYTLVATNNGPSTAAGPITIVDDLDETRLKPTNLVGTNCTLGAGSTPGLICTYDPTTGIMTILSPNELPNGATITVIIPVEIK